MRNTICIVILVLTTTILKAQETINYASKDGLTITADLYKKEGASTFIILFHQARWSRGEYKEIAPKLNAKGYACMAVDQRSGGEVNGVVNKTYEAAVAEGNPTAYIDAYQDIEASIAYVKEIYHPEKIIIWGSSYSSALVLKYGGDNPDAVAGILSFAPGEYYEPKDLIAKSAKHIKVPVFITSAKNEYNNWKGIFEVITTTTKQNYLPKTKGNHGSRALWEEFSDNAGYWEAVTKFLNSIPQ